MFRTILLGGALIASAAAPALADMRVADPYARSANPRTGAAFMQLINAGDADDVLIEARGDVARRIELHTHVFEDGIAKMREVEGGIPVPAGQTVTLQRGGLHVMMMGIETPLQDGGTVPLTLVFQSGEELQVEIPVDNERRPDAPAQGGMQGHDMKGHGQHGMKTGG